MKTFESWEHQIGQPNCKYQSLWQETRKHQSRYFHSWTSSSPCWWRTSNFAPCSITRQTLNSYIRFRNNKDITFKEIDAEEVQSYEAYLKNVARVWADTSSFYLCILRATYNKVVEKGYTTQQDPFKNVYTGIAKTKKRAISTEYVSSIKRMDSTKDHTPKQELARDAFLMSFYLRGISFIDLAHLRKSDLKDGFISYTRSKTGQRLSIRWEKEMQDILRGHHTDMSPLHLILRSGRCQC